MAPLVGTPWFLAVKFFGAGLIATLLIHQRWGLWSLRFGTVVFAAAALWNWSL
jgi:hypothetical protein